MISIRYQSATCSHSTRYLKIFIFLESLVFSHPKYLRLNIFSKLNIWREIKEIVIVVYKDANSNYKITWY